MTDASDPLADLLDHAAPSIIGYALASLAPAAVVLADVVEKRRARDLWP